MGKNFLREAWWGLFCDLLTIPIDSADALLQAANNTQETIANARQLADAAIDELEQRWVE